MKPSSLRPASELAQDKPHGTRLKYMGGCKCMLCRAANSRYETERAAKRRRGLSNGIVSAKRSQATLVNLSSKGLGRRAVAAATGIGKTTLSKIRSGKKKQVRQNTERRILALNSYVMQKRETMPFAKPRAIISAAPTWTLLNRLLRQGHSKAELARDLGYKSPALQIGKSHVTKKNAMRVQRYYDTVMAI